VGVREIYSGLEVPLMLQNVLNHCCSEWYSSLLILPLRNSALTVRCRQQTEHSADVWYKRLLLWVRLHRCDLCDPPVCVSASQRLVGKNTNRQMCFALATSGQSANDFTTGPVGAKDHIVVWAPKASVCQC